uniref:Uncharacterized protein n=1 Tax=Heterorhabditis bacteriophora TaxID=37862 RepID=A0A1I7W6V3_HETBA
MRWSETVELMVKKNFVYNTEYVSSLVRCYLHSKCSLLYITCAIHSFSLFGCVLHNKHTLLYNHFNYVDINYQITIGKVVRVIDERIYTFGCIDFSYFLYSLYFNLAVSIFTIQKIHFSFLLSNIIRYLVIYLYSLTCFDFFSKLFKIMFPAYKKAYIYIYI